MGQQYDDRGFPVPDPNKTERGNGQTDPGGGSSAPRQGGMWNRGGRSGAWDDPNRAVGTEVGGTSNQTYWDWINNAAKDLPGEDDYYKRQIGQVQRALGAQAQGSENSLAEALATRGFGAGTLTGSGYADIQRQTGAQLQTALGGINDARFAAREGRINAAQGRVFQDQQAFKNFQYQLQILKMQLAAQGKSDQAGLIEGLLSNLAQLFGGQKDPYSMSPNDPASQMNPPAGQHWNP